MKPPWRCMTLGDGVLILMLLAVAVAGIARLATTPRGGRIVVSDGVRTVYTAPLGIPRSVELTGPLGSSRLEIDDRGARIVDAPCSRKVCMTMGPIRHTGELIACIPNRILVRVDAPASEEAPFDHISR